MDEKDAIIGTVQAILWVDVDGIWDPVKLYLARQFRSGARGRLGRLTPGEAEALAPMLVAFAEDHPEE